MGGRWGIVRVTAAVMFVLWAVAILFPRYGSAADRMTVVTGIVEEVTGNSVFIHGKGYEIKGIPVLHPSGRRLAVSDIARGRKVDLYLRNKQITSVVLYDPMVE